VPIDAPADPSEAYNTRWAILQNELLKACGIASGLQRHPFPSDLRPSPVTEPLWTNLEPAAGLELGG
jgi:hypothetical protein